VPRTQVARHAEMVDALWKTVFSARGP
jgi:hypothetical protein